MNSHFLKIVFASALIAGGVCVLGYAAMGAKFPSIEDNRTEIILFSWKHRDQYYFALVPARDRARFISHLGSRQKALKTVPELERKIAKVPQTSVVAWRDDLSNGMTYPPQSIIRRIQKYASTRGVDLQIIPGIYD
jgi:hypothetical protein